MNMAITISGWVLAIILGLGWGGFITMAVDRLARGVPCIGRGPYCAMCDHPLVLADYWPIISYFRWQGTCRYCHQSFPANGAFLATEIGALCVSLVSYGCYGWSEPYLIVTSIGYICVILAVLDVGYRIISAALLALLTWLASIYRLFIEGSIEPVVVGAVLGSGLAIMVRTFYYALKGSGWRYGCSFLLPTGEERFRDPDLQMIALFGIAAILLPWPIWGWVSLWTVGAMAVWKCLYPTKIGPYGAILCTSMMIALWVNTI